MTAADFAARFPKPWRFVICQVSFSMRAANGAVIGVLNLQDHHSGIPQKEWQRHVAGTLSEYLPVIEGSEVTTARRSVIESRSAALRPAAEPPPAERTASATQSPEPKRSAPEQPGE